MRPTRLPDARYFALTWAIPENYAGMTTAIFRRSRAFDEHGAAVTVLTFDARPDYPEFTERLRANGTLSPGTTILNLWEWLREHDLPGKPVPPGAVFSPIGSLEGLGKLDQRDGLDKWEHLDLREADGWPGETALTRTRMAEDDRTVLQVDYFRADGSLLASDRRDCRKLGTPGGRSVVLCDRNGQPLSHWSRIIPLYHAWVDALTGGENSVLIIDSKTVATSFIGYRRRNVLTVHVVHGSHLADPRNSASGFSATRRHVFENLNEFNATVLLSERQRQDVLSLAPEARTLRVIPNAVPLGPSPAPHRNRDAGVMLASLHFRKRVEDAIAASASANARLDVYGDGPLRDRLQREIDDSGAGDRIRLRGYDAAAKDQLAAASFLLLTSTAEGFPLVLLESMAAGCIPIAYDVRYGPDELIRDGENGFLVPDGDRAALAAAIVRLQRMPEPQVRAMREQARETAEQYSPDAIMARWASQLHRLLRLKRRRSFRARLRRRIRRLVLSGFVSALNSVSAGSTSGSAGSISGSEGSTSERIPRS
ncbi:glycosyltransferase [Diaminobutyricimonas sp. LJ205]|uniref:glycosyltransferase n=1 Tax=Diaminobutyricimonas sp. LJ205 TaxID=2683590 RepID=UPI0012F4AEF8|nr:glycosyltransferase [Diaminobutyricimonas sp. LJ205]